MRDRECVEFLRWALPRLGLRWQGFRRVRRQVCRRLARRLRELALEDLAGYRAHLAGHEAEWAVLDGLCRISISRCYRDRAVWEVLRHEVLPALARAARADGRPALRAWSAGCASGEEPYSLTAVWQLGARSAFPELSLAVLASDADPRLLERARDGTYPASSLKDFPVEWRDAAFAIVPGGFRARALLREAVAFRCADLRGAAPEGRFDLVLCRNLAFTYFDEASQEETATRLGGALVPGGALVVGRHEALPPGVQGFEPWHAKLGIHRRAP